jgi:NADPH-dependent 2,4-dienoyl-CoA reductase/sulfur reductase-like enzyme
MVASLIQELPIDFVIIGAGPAGLAAAAAAAQLGVDGLLVERDNRLGGQYAGAHPNGHATRRPDPDLEALRWRIKFLEKSDWRIIFQSVIASVESAGEMRVFTGGRLVRVKYQVLLVATGAREWIRPFLGWTLPGVFTTGAAVRLAVRDGIAAGKRVLVAGSGPLLLSSAAQLVRAGVNVAALVEAAPWRQLLSRGFPALLRSPDRISQFIADWRAIQRAGVPLLPGQGLVEAHGRERVSEVVTADLDAAGGFVPASERRWEVDALAVCHGLEPDTRLCRLLGCDLVYDPRLGTHHVHHDINMATSCPSVYVAGEAAGIGGVRKALVEGEIAGLQAAISLGQASAEELEARLERLRSQKRKWASQYHRLQAAFLPAYRIPAGPNPETMVCRCEEVSLETLHTAIHDGDGTLRDLKLRTRFGMGICQGRLCETNVHHELARLTGQGPEQIEPLRIRPPLEPLPLSVLAAEDE